MATAAIMSGDAELGANRTGWIFVATILTGSFLLFMVQPMIARMALPRLGGAPAVWNSAMLVYQALLLGGYAYAHAISRFSARYQALIHIALFALAALWLPLGLVATNPPADASPIFWVPWFLAISIGPLFFMVSAQAPLMQRWFSLSSGGRDPYALYAASNLGSFGGLLAYPLLVEPNMSLASQSRLWTIGYVVLVVFVIGCAVRLVVTKSSSAIPVVEERSAPPSLRRQLGWIAMAAVPSGLMLSTTTHLTTDIVAMPLLWVIPLGLYLLSFSVAFATRRTLADLITRAAPLLLLALGILALQAGSDIKIALALSSGLILLFVVAVALHTRMYRDRPAADQLTRFYLVMSLGGMIGGLFAALIAPALFDWTYEHPLLLLAAAALLPQKSLFQNLKTWWKLHQKIRIALLLGALAALGLIYFDVIPTGDEFNLILANGGLLVIGILAAGRRPLFVAALAGILLVNSLVAQISVSWKGDARVRSYFGVYTMLDRPESKVRTISHGTTVHGVQSTVPGRERELTAYYVEASGVGRGLAALRALHPANARVGVVGLGAGTLACAAKPGESWRFYEIDPAIVDIARNEKQFSFLARCAPHVPIDIGDARLTLATAPAESLDFLALDAFSSDAVPMHLLTLEAFATYRRVLAKDGLLLVHISNRYLELEPVVAAAAAKGWFAAALPYEMLQDPKAAPHASPSLWIALSPSRASIAQVHAVVDKPVMHSRPPALKPGFEAWTDDYSSTLPLIKAWMPDK